MAKSSTPVFQDFASGEESTTLEWTRHRDPQVQKVVTGSLLEKIILCVFYAVCVIYIPSVNSLVIHVVRKTSSLRTPQYFFICCYAMCDLLYSVTTHTMAFLALLMNLTTMPEWLCRLEGTVHAGVFFTSCHALGIIAYERYCCFFKPLSYEAYFSTNRMVFLAVVPHVIGQIFSLFIELYVGRHYFTTMLVCNSSGPDLVYINPVVICLFYLPSALMSLVCLIRLILLIKRQHIATAPIDSTAESSVNIIGLQKAVKIVLLVSGTFWATSVPAFIGRTALFATGATWTDMDTRANMAAYVVSRMFNFTLSTASALINPIIYIVVHKELRKACLKRIPCIFKEHVED